MAPVAAARTESTAPSAVDVRVVSAADAERFVAGAGSDGGGGTEKGYRRGGQRRVAVPVAGAGTASRCSSWHDGPTELTGGVLCSFVVARAGREARAF